MNPRFNNGAVSRRDRLIHEHLHDPYQSTRKLPEPSVCPGCNAVYQAGRWQWAESWPVDARQETCPACRRTKDGYPAGEVVLSGGFLEAHKAEILSLVWHQEEEEKRMHPLHRIMGIEEGSDAMVIRTTDIHLPRRIGEALRHAYKGGLEMNYQEEGYFVRLNWKHE